MLTLITLEFRKLFLSRSAQIALLVSALLPLLWAVAPRLNKLLGDMTLISGWQMPAVSIGVAVQFMIPLFIALVVAETFEQARDAALNARADYDDRSARGVFVPAEAKYEAPRSKQSAKGDLDEAMDEAAFAVDVEYHTPSMSHAAMEPHAAVAWWDGGHVTLRGSYQMLGSNKAELADALGISPRNVRILSPYVGGGFGSKLGISHEGVAAAIAAQKLGRPVAARHGHVVESVVHQQAPDLGMHRLPHALGVSSGGGLQPDLEACGSGVHELDQFDAGNAADPGGDGQ